MEIVENIKQLLKSRITSYEISRGSGVTRQSIDKYRREPSSIENMTLKNALALSEYWENLKPEEVIELERDVIERDIKVLFNILSKNNDKYKNTILEAYLEPQTNHIWIGIEGEGYRGDYATADKIAKVVNGAVIEWV